MECRQVEARQAIFEEGAVGHEFYVLPDGVVARTSSSSAAAREVS